MMASERDYKIGSRKVQLVYYDEPLQSPFGVWESKWRSEMAQESASGVWEVWFVLGPGEDEHRDYVWTSQVACEDKNSAIAIATGELEEETLKRLKRTLVRPFIAQ